MNEPIVAVEDLFQNAWINTVIGVCDNEGFDPRNLHGLLCFLNKKMHYN